ncbi:general odorant-binding protein 99a-like [Episyrphus balteatus]|uniref:general odorant-binding protein 99a-like n=1 Tax=Episyrphus balteatus TaxID=286459 RepID=UPI0024850058|nr:general odorant-binding protein 99a-like [Episyrphus balteatus]
MAFILLFCALVSTSPIQKGSSNKSRDYGMVCMDEHKIPFSDFRKYNLFNQPPEDLPVYCYIKCILEKSGIFDKETGFLVDSIQKHLKSTSETLVKIEHCIKNTNQIENMCEGANRGAICLNIED